MMYEHICFVQMRLFVRTDFGITHVYFEIV